MGYVHFVGIRRCNSFSMKVPATSFGVSQNSMFEDFSEAEANPVASYG